MRDIIDSVRRASPQGGFVKKVNGEWFDVGERARREKTGQQIRDLLHTSYKSSTKAKARTRKSMRGSGERLPPRSASAPKSSSSASASRTSQSSLPARVVTLDSKTRNTEAIQRIAMQSRMLRQNSEPDLSQAAGLQSLQSWNLQGQQQQQQQLPQQQQQLPQQQPQGFPGQMSMTNFMQQQQSSLSLAEQLQLQHQMGQQQNQLLPQQQLMQQGLFNADQQLSQNFGASQQSSFLSNMGSLAQQQQQQQFDTTNMITSMSNLSHNPFLNAGAASHTQPFVSSNTRPQNPSGSMSTGMFQQNEGMGHRYGTEDLEPMPVYDNDTSGSTRFDESEVSYEEFDNVFHRNR